MSPLPAHFISTEPAECVGTSRTCCSDSIAPATSLTEPLQSPGTAQAAGHHTGQPAGVGPLAGLLGHGLRRRRGRQCRILGSSRHANPIGDLSNSRHPLHRGCRVPLGRRDTGTSSPGRLPIASHIRRPASGLPRWVLARGRGTNRETRSMTLDTGPALQAALLHHRNAAAQEHPQHPSCAQALPPPSDGGPQYRTVPAQPRN